MTKTTAPRVRAENLYTVEQDGQPVAQAMAISQAEAVRLYVESVQQPTMTARLSSPLEARTLAGLPLLTRCETVRDEAAPDLFEGAPMPTAPAVISRDPDPETVDAAHEAERAIAAAHEIPDAEFIAAADALPMLDEAVSLFTEPAAARPAAPVSPVVGAVVDPVLLATYCPPVELPVKTYPPAVLAQVSADVARYQAAKAGRKPAAMYRDPVSGQSWSGRGLKPKWLLAALEAGQTQDEFLIDAQGAQA